MKIEPSLAPSPIAKGQTDAQAKPSPDVEQLLSELKVRLGDKITALVSKVTSITADEQQQLLRTKVDVAPAPQKQSLQALLSQPTLKLVALTHQQVAFTAVTSLPVSKGQQLTVMVDTKGLQLLVNGELSPTRAVNSPQNMPANEHKMPSSRFEAMSVKGNGVDTDLLGAAARRPAIETGPHVSPKVGSADGHFKPHSSPPNELAALPTRSSSSRTAASVQAIAAAVASALPKAQPTSVLLDANTKLVALLQHVPSHALPPSLKPLLALLSTLQQQPLELTSSKPLAPSAIAKAFSNNGVFHEGNALRSIARSDEAQAKPLNEHDIKALLIKTVDGLSQLGPSQTNTGAKQSLTNDAVARLWLGLVNGLSPKDHTQKMSVSSKENLLLLTQNLAQNSLAKIQLNQYRSLAPVASETGTTSQVIHLDIPIKWPDTYGNAYLQIFPPKVTEDESKASDKPKRLKQMRWRIFMELEMGDEGNLAVELTVADTMVDATFWAEKDHLRQKAAAHLQALRNDLTDQGLQVTDLRCSSNPPPEQKMNIDYAIIDVRT